jgi:hypothetical protein
VCPRAPRHALWRPNPALHDIAPAAILIACGFEASILDASGRVDRLKNDELTVFGL